MPGWLSRNNFSLSDFVHASDLNNLANDNITWGGDVNGGGYHLSNVILQGSGGFSSYVSPVEVTPGSTGSSCVQLDQTVGANHVARWTVCKDTTAESGGNTGSNFGISRYTDAGVFIDSPIAINRATGLITMGAQQWNGAVNGGGNTLTNVILSGVSVPGTVPTTRAINTGVGLSGGGTLAADLTLVGVAFKASGASHAAGDVPDPGPTAGTTRFLREDATFAVPPGAGGGTANYWVNSALVGTQPTLNLIAGANVTLGGVVNAGRVDITITASGTGGTGSPQTPWASNIDGGNFALGNVSQIGIGTATPDYPLTFAATLGPKINLFQGSNYGLGLQVNVLQLFSSSSSTRVGIGYGSSAGFTETLSVIGASVGIGTTAPAYTLHAVGNLGVAQAGANIICGLAVDPGSAAANQVVGGYFYDSTANVLRLECLTGGVAWRSISLCTRGGNVGIGTAAPWAPMTVASGGYNTASLTHQSPSTASFTGSASATELAIFNAVAQPNAISLQTRHSGVDGQTYPLALNPLGGGVGVGIVPISSFPFVVHTATNVNLGFASSSGLSLQAVNDAQNSYVAMSIYAAAVGILNGSVGIGTAAPRSALSIIAGLPTTPATATQLTIGESTNNSGYQLALGYYYDSVTGGYKGVIQTLAGGNPWPTLLNPTGGKVAIGTAQPDQESTNCRLAVLGSAGQQASSLATSNSQAVVSIRPDSNSGYTLAIGSLSAGGLPYLQGVNFNGGAAAAQIVLEPFGGFVGIGRTTTPAYMLDVGGDVNCTGAFRVNGTALAGGGVTTGGPVGGRAVGTTYTNSNPTPLYLSITMNVGSGTFATLTIAGSTVAQASIGGSGYANLFGVVLPGQTYSVTSAGTVAFWAEWH